MIGNFSIGDYFKQGAVEFAWDLSLEGFGFEPDDIWVTVFEGDEELGIGLDEEAIEAWLEVGVPRERIVRCNRTENFWEAGPTGPCGPCSELYLDRGLDFGKADDLPGGDNERFLEYWNLVFMQYDQEPRSALTPLPAKNIDTGLGLERLAALLQGVPSVFETDPFRPLVDLGEELSGRKYGTRLPDRPRAADPRRPHARDELPARRRRRALQRGPRLPAAADHAAARSCRAAGSASRARSSRRSRRVRDVMGGAYPELAEQAETIEMWLGREEERVHAHARAGHAAAQRAHRAREGPRAGGHRRRGGVPAARHLRLPVRADR